VLIDGEGSATGAGFVVTDSNGEQLAELAHGEGILKRAEREWPTLYPDQRRFVTSILLRSEGLPDPLGREMLILPKNDGGVPLHVVRTDPSSETDAPSGADRESLLVAETLLPAVRSPEPLDGAAREQVMETLTHAFPFVGRHIIAVDSPHDGRPLWLFESDRDDEAPKKIERIHLQGASVAPEPMTVQWRVDGSSFLDIAGEPVRGPIGRTLLVGSSVLPALGQEGELMAAWSAVRVITRADGQKERIRRAMWNKVEIG
jgi:hypothetical protein